MRVKKTFGSLLYDSFRSTYGPFISLIGIILVFVGYYIVPSSETISAKHVLLIFVVLLYVNFIFIHAAYIAHKNNRVLLPAVKYSSAPPIAYQPSVALLLLEDSELFSYDAIVGVYKSENEIEQLIGIGRVINIQENGKIQILVTNDLGYSSDWAQYITNNITLLQKMLVKPTVPAFAMEATLNG